MSQAGGTLESDLGHRFSPQPHGLESGGADTLHRFGEGSHVDRHLVDRQAPQPDLLVRCTRLARSSSRRATWTPDPGRWAFVGEGGPISFPVSELLIHKQITLHGS